MTPDRAALLELASRAEVATGPDYALDCAIWDAIYPGERQGRFDKLTAKGQPYHCRLGPADVDGYCKPLRAFTASIDAAITLRPPGWTIANLGEGDDGSWWCELREGYLTSYGKVALSHLRCETPALALCAAALRARASITPNKDETDGN